MNQYLIEQTEKQKKERLGVIYGTNNFGDCEIIEYRTSTDLDIRFDDGFVLKNTNYANLIKGSVKNPMKPNVYDIGYIGDGIFSSKTDNDAYRCWVGMFRRCYDIKFHIKFPSYSGCSVSKEWHNFQNFAAFYVSNCRESFVLDKDILFKNNMIYGEKYARFVPREINSLFISSKKLRGKYPIGVFLRRGKFSAENTLSGTSKRKDGFLTIHEAFLYYKTTRETYIKEKAMEYKPVISEDIYRSMMSWTVEITD